MTQGLARYHAFLKAAKSKYSLTQLQAQAFYRAFKANLDRQPVARDLRKPVSLELARKAPRQARAYQKAKAEGKPLKPVRKPARKPVAAKKPRKRVKPLPAKPKRPKRQRVRKPKEERFPALPMPVEPKLKEIEPKEVEPVREEETETMPPVKGIKRESPKRGRGRGR